MDAMTQKKKTRINLKKALSEPKFRRSIFYCLAGLLSVLIILPIALKFRATKSPIINLEKKVLIENLIKIEAQPIRYNAGESIVFKIKLESFENADLLALSPLDIALLQDDEGTPYLPIEWEIQSKNEHKIGGTLTFPADFKKPATIKLSMYEHKDTYLEWTIQ
jgi:hypothetical protein